MKPCTHPQLENVRPWPGEDLTIGECVVCGSTISAQLNPDHQDHDRKPDFGPLFAAGRLAIQRSQDTRNDVRNQLRLAAIFPHCSTLRASLSDSPRIRRALPLAVSA